MMFMVRNGNGDWTKEWKDVLKDYSFLKTVEEIEWKYPLGELWVQFYKHLYTPQLHRRLVNIAESDDYSGLDLRVSRKECFIIVGDGYVEGIYTPNPDFDSDGYGKMGAIRAIEYHIMSLSDFPVSGAILCQRQRRSVLFIIKELPDEPDEAEVEVEEESIMWIRGFKERKQSTEPITLEDRTLEEKGGVPACEDFPYPQ